MTETRLGRIIRNPVSYIDRALYLGAQHSALVFAAYLSRVALHGRAQREAVEKSVQSVLSVVERDGIAVIPDLLTAGQCETVLLEAREWLDPPGANSAHPTTPSTRVINFPEYRTTRITGLDLISPTGRAAFCKHALLQEVAETYARGPAPMFQTFIERKQADAPCGDLESWHFDGFDKRFKAFVYLCAVDEDNGPFEYLLGSHTLDWRKFLKFYRWHRSRGRVAASHTDPSHYQTLEAEDVLERYARITVTGAPGTAFVFDGRGIHRGRTLKRGERLVAANYYRSQNF